MSLWVLKDFEVFFRLSDAMEDDEEHSEAQESDSGFGKASKVEESFRLFHELYLKPVCPVRKLQVYFHCIVTLCNQLYTVWLISEEYEYTLERKLSCLVCDTGVKTKSFWITLLSFWWIRLLNTHQMQICEKWNMVLQFGLRKAQLQKRVYCAQLCVQFLRGLILNYFTVGLCMFFLHTKKFCRQIRQLLIITYSITGTTKSLGLEFSSFLLHLAKGPGPLTLVDHFCTGRLRGHQTLAFCTQYIDLAWVTSVRYWLSLDVNILTAFLAMLHSQQRADWLYGIGLTSWWLVWMTWTLQMTCMTKWWRPSIMPLLSVAQEPASQRRTSSGGGSIFVFVQEFFYCSSEVLICCWVEITAVAGFCEHMSALIICSL